MFNFKWKNKYRDELSRDELLEVIENFHNKILNLKLYIKDLEGEPEQPSYPKYNEKESVDMLKNFFGFK